MRIAFPRGRVRGPALLLIMPFLVAACSGSGGANVADATISGATRTPTAPVEATATPSPAATATAEPTEAPAPAEIDFASPSTLENADAEFSYSAMIWQGYWLSRDQFGPLAMGSGLGVPFQPPMEKVMGAMKMVGGGEGNQPFLPDNLFPLQAVYRSGDTGLLNDIAALPPTDFNGLRLDPSTFEEIVGVEGQAELMLKESQWARNFHTASHFGDPDSDFGAQQRFLGMMVSMLSQVQGQYAMQNLMDPSTGLYADGDGTVDYRGNWTLLQAFADIAGITGDSSLRYFNPDSHGMFAKASADLLAALADREPESSAEWAAAIRALSFVAWTADDSAVGATALVRIGSLASSPPAAASASERAAKAAGLIAAGQALQDGTILKTARPVWDALAADFDPSTGTFRSESRYRVDDVAWVIGGLNALALGGPEDLRADAAVALVAFFEALIDNSGLQLAAPPGKNGAMAGAFEKDLPSVVYYHGRNTPPPPMAGGDFGRATLPAAEVEFKAGGWSVTDTRFESAGGMHLANELNWLGPHLGSVMFPPLAQEKVAGGETGGESATEITVTAANIQFDVDELIIPSGEDVTITFVNDDDAIPHSLHISGPGGFNVATEIFTGNDGRSRTLSFTAPAPGEYTFVCDVHPAQMTGRIIVK